MHARSYNSVEQYAKDERERQANGERAINHYPLQRDMRTWGELFHALWRGFVVGVGMVMALFILFCVGRFLWQAATR